MFDAAHKLWLASQILKLTHAVSCIGFGHQRSRYAVAEYDGSRPRRGIASTVYAQSITDIPQHGRESLRFLASYRFL